MNLELLKQICAAPGAPGFEDRVRDLIVSEVSPSVDSIQVDNMGNVVATVLGKDSSKTIMVAAHMDEIGFIVRHIDDKGFIKFIPLGGFDPKTLTAQRVIVHGKKDLVGVMGVKPIHIMSAAERTKMPEVMDFYIDLGMSKKEVEKIVKVGDSVTRERELIEMGNGECVNVKSLDNRAGCYVLIEAIRQMTAGDKRPDYNFVGVFTVQEEVGLRGAHASTLTVKPDFAIALDVTLACDTPGTAAHETISKIGGGASIKLLDGTVISDRRLVAFMRAMAEQHKIKYQEDMLAAGGTDAGAMQKFVPGGSIVGGISIPTRNIHQVIEMASKKDIDACVDLLAACALNMAQWNWAWGADNAQPQKAKKDKVAKAEKKAKKAKKPKVAKVVKVAVEAAPVVKRGPGRPRKITNSTI